MNKVTGLFSLLCLSLCLGVASPSFAQEQVLTYGCEGAFFGSFSMSPIELMSLKNNKPDLYYSASVRFYYNGSYGVNQPLKVSQVVSFKNNNRVFAKL